MPNSEELLDEGNSALALGELEQAVEWYRQSTVHDPAFFEGWQALGMALVKLNRAPEAVEALKTAVTLHPDDQMAWSSLSLAYGRNGQIQEAEDAGAKARILSWGGKVSKMKPVEGPSLQPPANT
ncbi:MAG: tetratricopeptide repeat protein [Candidatus Methylacidiphilales bacterium]|nr:tetratricopeptide repeat protein [Candidatus Methylacidiphilales bacterium]